MQVEFNDGSKGERISADTVAELLPKIEEALKNSDVKCVRVFRNGSKVQGEGECKTAGELMKENLSEIKKVGKVIKLAQKAVTRTFPRKR